MDKIDVKFTFSLPISATEKEIEEWVKFQLGYTASISNENPLSDYDIEADSVDIYFK